MTTLNKRGLQEGLASLSELHTLLTGLAQEAERTVAEAEGRLTAYRKLASFVTLQREQFRQALAAVEEAEKAP